MNAATKMEAVLVALLAGIFCAVALRLFMSEPVPVAAPATCHDQLVVLNAQLDDFERRVAALDKCRAPDDVKRAVRETDAMTSSQSREEKILARAARRQAKANEQARRAEDRAVLIEAAASVDIAPEHIEAEIDHAGSPFLPTARSWRYETIAHAGEGEPRARDEHDGAFAPRRHRPARS